ncbi:MAG: YezD family protein [Verrucomicrobiota bacterium JB024]|nr:YezD family protein [Verrucomicrobiota bacterium JB024]
MSRPATAAAPHSETQPWQRIVREKVAGLRFGVIQIVVHNGKVTQIECTEKTRLDESSGSPGSR